MLGGNVVLFAQVVFQIVKLSGIGGRVADGFPISHPHCLFKAAFVKLPVQEFRPRRFLPSKTGGIERPSMPAAVAKKPFVSGGYAAFTTD